MEWIQKIRGTQAAVISQDIEDRIMTNILSYYIFQLHKHNNWICAY